MNGFRRKLRQFRETWIAQSEQGLPAARAIVGFLFNADDTPRFWAGDRPWIEATPTPGPVQLPRFRQVATSDLDDAERRAA